MTAAGTRKTEFVSFRTGAALHAELADRGPRTGPVARRDLGRYYPLLRAALREAQWTSREARLLCDFGVLDVDSSDGTATAHRLWWIAAAEKSGEADLAAKLYALSQVGVLAAVDAVERVRLALERGEPQSALLRAFGLID